MKIFKIVQLTDGGPNDRGTVVGFIKAMSQKSAELHRQNSFEDILEISEEDYLARKKQAEENLKMYWI